MKGGATLAALALLAACAAPGAGPTGPLAAGGGAAVPRTAILYRDTVTVQFSDGALCVAQRPGAVRAWSGRLSGCPHLLDYQVALPEGRLAPRQVLVRLARGGTAVLNLPRDAFGLPGPA